LKAGSLRRRACKRKANSDFATSITVGSGPGCEIVEALVHAAVVEGRLALASDALEDEIVRVLLGYVSALRASESAGSARG